MGTLFNRSDLERAFGKGNPKLIQAFESLQANAVLAARVSTANADATTELQDATAITLSLNAAPTNERILAVDAASMFLRDNGAGNTVVIGLLYPIATNGGFAVTLNLIADTSVSLPVDGNIPSSTNGPYADDTAAGLAGIAIGDWYAKTGGTVVWRQV